jgi:hypothetical protein
MPHGINYIHGSAHYNSGILVFTDFTDTFGHFTDRQVVLRADSDRETERNRLVRAGDGRAPRQRGQSFEWDVSGKISAV